MTDEPRRASPWTVRPAVAADARGIAEVHVATWRAAYAGIVPQAHLDGLSAERRAEQWNGWFAQPSPGGMHVWVAEDADDRRAAGPPSGEGTSGGDRTGAPAGGRRIVGFSNVGPSRDEDAAASTGELRAIYVLQSHWDTGVGRVLHDRGIESLRAGRFADATLWVLADNTRARLFYERRGWRTDGDAKTIDILGVALAEVRYRIGLSGDDAGGASGPAKAPPRQ